MSSHLLLSATLFRGLWFGKDLILDALPDKTLPICPGLGSILGIHWLEVPLWLALTAKILYLNLTWELKVKYCWYVYCKSCDYKAKQWKGSCLMPLIHFCEIRMNSHLSAFWLKIVVIMYIRFAQHFTDICFTILHYSGRCLCRWQKNTSGQLWSSSQISWRPG